MNLFECVLKTSGGGNGTDLIVTCNSVFAGATITCTDGGSNTFTAVCPSTSPYEVTFANVPFAVYTVSTTYGGTTYSITVSVLSYTANLSNIPVGATVTPTNDIQIWLHCADIWDKNYSTISEVLSDTTTLLALISDNNAADYMARSTTWASTIVADQTAMTYISANDYCADVLLNDSTWRTAICNSTYFGTVLNQSVPTMTSNTTPSGQVIYSSQYSASQAAYLAFDKVEQNTNYWFPNGGTGTNAYIGYKFTAQRKIYKVRLVCGGTERANTVKFILQGSNDNSSWNDIGSEMTVYYNSGEVDTNIVNPSDSYLYYRLKVTSGELHAAGSYSDKTVEIQFYGR